MCWAEADIAHAASALKALRADTEWRRSLGERAALEAGRLFSAESYARKVKSILDIG
jgi:hypothetical protein